jgi:hypothetical protein
MIRSEIKVSERSVLMLKCLLAHAHRHQTSKTCVWGLSVIFALIDRSARRVPSATVDWNAGELENILCGPGVSVFLP